jgi:hypothetical protein
MPRGIPVDPETRALVLELHGQTLGRNEIARQTGISAFAVTTIVRNAGLSFDRTQSEQAVKARTVDLAERRTALAQRMMVVAEEILEGVDQPYLVYSFSKDGGFTSHTLDMPPIEAQRSMMVTAAIAFDKATKVVEKQNPGLEGAIGVLDTMAQLATAAVERMREQAGETPADDEDDGVRLPDDA